MECMQKKDNSLIDVVKILFAVLILMAHYAALYGHFPAMIDYCFSLYIVCVPFFFACSGYFLYKKVMSSQNVGIVYKNYIIRILKLYISWSAIYFCFKIGEWIVNGTDIATVLQYFYKAIVFSTYPTIWFLPACAIAAVIMWKLDETCGMAKTAIMAVTLYAIGALGYSYSFLIAKTPLNAVLDGYMTIFISTRNGVFNGFPWLFLGCWIAHKEGKRNTVFYGVASCVFLILTVVEAVAIKILFNSTSVDTIFMLIPFIYCFFNFLLKAGDGVSIKAGKWMRNMSTLIFVCQRIFLTGIPSMLPGLMAVICRNSWRGAAVVLGLTLLLSQLILIGAKHNKLLRNLM